MLAAISTSFRPLITKVSEYLEKNPNKTILVGPNKENSWELTAPSKQMPDGTIKVSSPEFNQAGVLQKIMDSFKLVCGLDMKSFNVINPTLERIDNNPMPELMRIHSSDKREDVSESASISWIEKRLEIDLDIYGDSVEHQIKD